MKKVKEVATPVIRRRLQCLQLSLKQWQWLEKHPSKSKVSYFNRRSKRTGQLVVPGHEVPRAMCWACQCGYEENGLTWGVCSFTCILHKLWLHGCLRNNSPYALWWDAVISYNYRKSKKYAGVIVKGCRAAIKELKKQYEFA